MLHFQIALIVSAAISQFFMILLSITFLVSFFILSVFVFIHLSSLSIIYHDSFY